MIDIAIGVVAIAIGVFVLAVVMLLAEIYGWWE